MEFALFNYSLREALVKKKKRREREREETSPLYQLALKLPGDAEWHISLSGFKIGASAKQHRLQFTIQ